MNLSDEDKATLIAAAKILVREPDEFLIEGIGCDACEFSGATNEEVAEKLCDMTELPIFHKMIPVKFLLAKM